MTEPRRRKRIRLDAEAYSVSGTTWHVTLATEGSAHPFADTAAAAMMVSTLEERCAKSGVNLLLYCIMPDHVHVLVQIQNGNLIAFVRVVKSIAGIWWRKLRPGCGDIWQRSFYDRGVRDETAMAEVVGYILNNPVAEGLAEDWSQYQWVGGSLVTDVNT